MGATAYFRILSDEEADRIRSHPDEIEDVLFPEDGPANPFEGQGYLEKAWHPIHYILSGSAQPTDSPLGQAVLGGDPIGADLGYGKARLLSGESVVLIAAALKDVDFRQAFEAADKSPEKLEGLYLGKHLAQEFDYLAHHFPGLVEVYDRAAKTRSSILAYHA